MPEAPDLRSTLAAAPITRDVVRVSGPEATDFLQGQLSQDVAGLAIDSSAPSLLLAPTGKVDAWLRVTRLGEDDFILDVAAGFGDAVHTRLRRFKLRTKAELEPATWSGYALRGPGAAEVPAPTGGLRTLAAWPGVEAVDVIADGGVTLEGVPTAPEEALEALRIECGVPAMGAELTEATIPAEAGQWLIDSSVSFTKGCYTGQELVARVDSRGGRGPRPVRGLLLDAPAPVGAEVSPAGADPVGQVTSAAVSPALGAIALAVLARSADVGHELDVVWDGGGTRGTVAELPLR